MEDRPGLPWPHAEGDPGLGLNASLGRVEVEDHLDALDVDPEDGVEKLPLRGDRRERLGRRRR
jgi:hypothetical protein